MARADESTGWLVLVHQFPQGPGSLRVRIWRRLHSLGAVALKQSMYLLPIGQQAQEDFQWVLAELTAGGAEGAILEARFIDGMTDAQVRALFNAARDVDYGELLADLQAALAEDTGDTAGSESSAQSWHRTVARARKRLADIEAIDFFGADGHDAAEAAMRALSEHAAERSAPAVPGNTAVIDTGERGLQKSQDLHGKVWVTRHGVRVDRIASAWLIRRWIDPDACFHFVSGGTHVPTVGELRFDMFEGEFTHQGDRCTFEVLAEQVAPQDAALRAVAEIVHDIDLKDGKFDRPEAQGVANILNGIVARTQADDERIQRGSELFEDLYRSFSGAPR